MTYKRSEQMMLIDFIKQQIENENVNVAALSKEAGVAESAVRAFLRGERPGIKFISIEKLLSTLGYEIIAQPINRVRPGQSIELSSLEEAKNIRK